MLLSKGVCREIFYLYFFPWFEPTSFDLLYNFHINILRHHREITIVKFRIKTDTWQVTDSAVGCGLLWSLTAEFFEILYFVFMTPRCEAHPEVWPRGLMHTVESDSTVGCTQQSFLKIRISWRNQKRIIKCFSLFVRSPDGFESWKKMEVENLVAHSL